MASFDNGVSSPRGASYSAPLLNFAVAAPQTQQQFGS
jgi:hypothetical protein